VSPEIDFTSLQGWLFGERDRALAPVLEPETERAKTLVTLFDALGPEISISLRSVFGLMLVAEDEIALSQAKLPKEARDLREALHQCFLPLAPSDPVQMSEKLYRAHCRELLARIVSGSRLEPATDAEVVGVLSGVSLRVMLRSEAMLLYRVLFRRLFPEQADSALGEPNADERDAWCLEQANRVREEIAGAIERGWPRQGCP
jgi:hypothetical protein